MNIDLPSIAAFLNIAPSTLALIEVLVVVVLALLVIKVIGCVNRLLFTAAIIVVSTVVVLQALIAAGTTVVALISTLTMLILVVGALGIGSLVVLNRNPVLMQVLAQRLGRTAPSVQLPSAQTENSQLIAISPSAAIAPPPATLSLPAPSRPAQSHPAPRRSRSQQSGGDDWGF